MNTTVAIPYADGEVFQHFGKSKQFRIYTVSDGKTVASETADTDGTGHEMIGLWLVTKGVDTVICGNIGPGALGVLAAAGIKTFAGVSGSADDAVAGLISGELKAAAGSTCGTRAHGEGCGSHGCGGCRGCHGHG